MTLRAGEPTTASRPALRHGLLAATLLCGLLTVAAGAAALLASVENRREPGWRCDASGDEAAYSSCLEQAPLATPFQMHAGLWTTTLASAICAMVLVTALLAQTRRRARAGQVN